MAFFYGIMVEQDNNFNWYSVSGPSMFPFIRSNDRVLVKRVLPDMIKPGDTVVFKSTGDILVCHGICATKKIGDMFWFYTAGRRARKLAHELVPQERIIGKVVALKHKDMVVNLTAGPACHLRFYIGCLLREAVFRVKNFLLRVFCPKSTGPAMPDTSNEHANVCR